MDLDTALSVCAISLSTVGHDDTSEPKRPFSFNMELVTERISSTVDAVARVDESEFTVSSLFEPERTILTESKTT